MKKQVDGVDLSICPSLYPSPTRHGLSLAESSDADMTRTSTVAGSLEGSLVALAVGDLGKDGALPLADLLTAGDGGGAQ